MRAALAAALAAVAATLLLAAPASAKRTNTFQGECREAPAVVVWSDFLTPIPTPLTMVATVDGGSCTGTMNGERIDGSPLHLEWEIHGPQACGMGSADGRVQITIGGRSITGDVHYRRGGTTPLIYVEGDTSGYAFSLARALANLDNAQECSTTGIRSVEVMVEAFASPLGISSPAPKSKPKRFHR